MENAVETIMTVRFYFLHLYFFTILTNHTIHREKLSESEELIETVKNDTNVLLNCLN